MLKKFGVTGKLWLKLLSKFAFWYWQSGWQTKWATLRQAKIHYIDSIIIFCCKRPCFLGGFKGFSELVRGKPSRRIAHLRPTLSFWMLRDAKLVKAFSWQSESATMYRYISLYFSATHMQWLQKPSFWSFSQVLSHLIIPVCITVITCGTAFWRDWDLTKYWSFLKLATIYDFSVFHVWQSFKH